MFPKSNKNNGSKSTLIWLVVVNALVLAALFYTIQNIAQTQNPSEVAVEKYSSSIKKVDNLIKSLQKNVSFYNDATLLSLKTVANLVLPLEIGLVGKLNPFQVPTPPEKQLFKTIKK